MQSYVYYLFRKALCFTGLIHLHWVWDEEGIRCEDCGYFKPKATHLADLHAGGGW